MIVNNWVTVNRQKFLQEKKERTRQLLSVSTTNVLIVIRFCFAFDTHFVTVAFDEIFFICKYNFVKTWDAFLHT